VHDEDARYYNILDLLTLFEIVSFLFSGVHMRGRKGNLVQIQDGPAAVIGDEIHSITTVLLRMGRCGWRMIRESEDLPEDLFVFFGKEASSMGISGRRMGYPRSIT
jgi:hypothetical protein